MAQKKKDFTAAAAAAFESSGSIVDRILSPTPAQTPTPAAEQPKTDTPPAGYLPQKQYAYLSKSGDEVRVTFMLSNDNVEKLRQVCFAERCKQKHVINDALQKFFDDYEAKHGKLL